MSDLPHAVVTGGAGFIGSHLVDDLLADGHRVTSLDNLGSGRTANLAHISSGQFTEVTHDVREPLPDLPPADVVYHLASRASPADFSSHAVEIAMTNSTGTHHALEFAREHRARLILASTSEVYGDPEVHPQVETYNGNVDIRGPRAPYDESKRFAEALAGAYASQHGVDVRTARIFNTYGPRMRADDGRVVPNFCSQALRGDDLTIYGDGSQTRSFCYVDDLVAGLRACAVASADRAAGEVFNLGSTHEVTIADLAALVIDQVEADVGVTHEPLPAGDPQVRRPDITKAREVLDWEPSVNLQDGLERTLAFFREELA